MIDPRNTQLAKIIVDWSVKVKPEDKVLVECSDPQGLPLAKEIYKQVLVLGAYPYLLLGTEDLAYFFYKHASPKQLSKKPEIYNYIAGWLDKSIIIRALKNDRALATIKPEKLLNREKTVRPVYDLILKKPWVSTFYPTESMAQSAGMSLDKIEAFYFQACLQDWPVIKTRLNKIKKIMDNAKKVTVIGKKTNLTFSLIGRWSQAAAGEFNLPDGEVFAAPLDGTISGEIYFDFPSLRSGKEVKDIFLKFNEGEVVEYAASQNQDYLAQALKIDNGAGRPGEFALGANYGITKYMNNTLFDEKIGGTIHLALGMAYEEKEGGGINKSAIHWDLVKDMRLPGSQVIIDGKTVLKDGKIVGC